MLYLAGQLAPEHVNDVSTHMEPDFWPNELTAPAISPSLTFKQLLNIELLSP